MNRLRFPLVFTATQSSATPQTRVAETADGKGSTWTDDDEISVCPVHRPHQCVDRPGKCYVGRTGDTGGE